MVSQGIAALVHEAKVNVIKLPGMAEQVATAEYRNRLLERFSLMAVAKSLVNVTLINKDEEWDRKEVNFATLPDVLKLYLLIVSGAADIPATRLLGNHLRGSTQPATRISGIITIASGPSRPPS